MKSRFTKLIFAMLLVAVSLIPSGQTAGAKPQAAQLAKAPFEVRLRKLHLVRPDLISYPIMFEVYC